MDAFDDGWFIHLDLLYGLPQIYVYVTVSNEVHTVLGQLMAM